MALLLRRRHCDSVVQIIPNVRDRAQSSTCHGLQRKSYADDLSPVGVRRVNASKIQEARVIRSDAFVRDIQLQNVACSAEKSSGPVLLSEYVVRYGPEVHTRNTDFEVASNGTDALVFQ